jgi:hypothetical protein
MKLRYTCKEAVDVMVAGEDRVLTRGERLVLWMHLCVCRACPRFQRQLVLMRQAMRRWREQAPDQ